MGGPNSINSHNPIPGGGFNPGPAKAPDLKAFTLTLDDFRQFASGKYNTGLVPGERAGVHRTWERLESADLDPSEAASIRLAFAFALEDAGVAGDKMAAACKRLGLEADFSFSGDDAKVYTSLSRGEVRDIIAQTLGGKSGRDAPPKDEAPKLIGLDDSMRILPGDGKMELIDKDPDEELDIINEDEDGPFFKSQDEPLLRSNFRKPDILIEKEPFGMEEKAPELDEKQRKRIAQSNFSTIANAIFDHYGKANNLEREEIEDLIKRVDGWEDKLADCEKEEFGTKLRDLNQDLKDFILDNPELKDGLEELLAQKKKAQP